MRYLYGWLCACALLGVGCGGNGGNPPPEGPPASDVKGSIIDVHVTEMGDVSSTRGPMNFEIAAIVTGADGTAQQYLAGIANDGTFVIKDVPDGPYDLRFVEFVGAGALPPRYVMNAPREIDLGRVYVGRADAAPITTTPTDLSLTASGLVAWTDGDILELFSLGSGAAGELLPTTTKFPAAGATTLSNYHVDTSLLLSPNLVDGSKGDTAFISQLTGDPAAPTPYRSILKTFAPPSFTQMDGMPLPLAGDFVDVPQKMLSLNINPNEFSAFATAVHPDAQVVGKNVRLIAEPGGERATASLTPNLLICEALPQSNLPPSFSYGNPFPSAWAEVVSADVSYSVTHVAPTGVPKTTIVTMGQSGPAGSIASPVKPQLSPPIDIKVNGLATKDTLTGVGYTPTVTFSPPEKGTPAVYIIAIRRLDPGGSTTRTTAIFSTTDTTLRIPEGLLDFGYYYYLRISVRSNFDITHPFKSSTTNAYASALSGILTP